MANWRVMMPGFDVRSEWLKQEYQPRRIPMSEDGERLNLPSESSSRHHLHRDYQCKIEALEMLTHELSSEPARDLVTGNVVNGAYI